MNKKMKVIVELYKEYNKGKYKTVPISEKTLLEIDKEIPDLSIEGLNRIRFGCFVLDYYLDGNYP